MKKILFGFFCFIPAISQAFFSTTDNYELLEQSTIATVNGDFLDVTITEKIQGNAKITPFFALPSSAESVHFFIDGTGIPLSKHVGSERLELLFDEINKTKNTQLFRFGASEWALLFTSDLFIITNDEPTITKLKYRIKLDFLDDIFYAKLPEQKGTITLIINKNKKIYHFLPVCDSAGEIVKTDNQIVWQGECHQKIYNENFKFYFSEVPNPNLVYKTEEATYVAHLIDSNQFKEYKKIHFIIDKSGSIYGAKWDKTKEVLLQILEKVPASSEIKVDFFDDTLLPFNEEFKSNTRENQKKLTTYFDTTLPLGKTDQTLIETIYNDSDIETLVVLLGDFTSFLPQDSWWKTAPKNPFVILSFGENEVLALWAKMTGGFFLSIFETQDFVKSESFWQNFSKIFKPFLAQQIATKFPTQQEFLPYQHTQYATGISNFFVSRSFVPNKKISNETASFLPRIWAQRKLGSLTRKKLREGAITNAEKEAVFSIANVFGIKASAEDLSTFQELEILENPDKLGIQDSLRSSEFINHIPYYQEGLHRFPYNLKESQNQLHIAPFSEAQKQLFLEFSDILAASFSLMPKEGSISFCYLNRQCIKIEKDGRSQYQLSDKLYWRGYYLNHWANEYIKVLADKNIYKLTEEGNPLPDKKITRSEFVKMVVEFRYGKDFEPVPNDKPFPDIQEEYLKKVVALLVSKGIIHGYDDHTFRPERILSRAEAVKILLTMNGITFPENYKIPTAPPFSDIGGWETFWVITAKTKKIVQGYDNGKFGPHDSLTRGQAAKLIIENFKK